MAALSAARVARPVVAALVAARLAELRVARRNEAALRATGAREHGAAHFPAFFVLHPAWLLGMLFEPRPDEARPRWPLLAALAGTQAVRMWTMRTLGEQWTTRILITPGRERVTGGPYRWLRDPAYAAVAVEVVCAPLALRAPRTALAAGLANAALLAIRIPAEHRAESTRDVPSRPVG
ncbi:isoprenylcysteine carboxylmethyltransferase family protein [Spongisporangium articulatum]|uniref:Isoprenylcysteine carboxylmethyltransferase family protein n=1 Tax=Spongisporangium articulatum TaxID=3362603 RepID=A0ABW8ATB9_9ACTN